MAVSAQDSLRGRWVTDARREEAHHALDEKERSRQMRRRLQETYRSDIRAAMTTPAASVRRDHSSEAIDLEV